MFIVFDLLHRNGRDLIGRPLRERRTRLEAIVADADLVQPVRRLSRNGLEAWSEGDYEGLVAKDEASLYEPGPTRQSGRRAADDAGDHRPLLKLTKSCGVRVVSCFSRYGHAFL